MIDFEVRHLSPEQPSEELVARLRAVLGARKRVARAYLVNRSVYEQGRAVQQNKAGLVVELRGWFIGRKHFEELKRDLEPVLREHLSTYWSHMSNHAQPEIRGVGMLVFERKSPR